MSLTEIKEKSLLKEWAAANEDEKLSKKILSYIDKTCESYWVQEENEAYILEYGFDSMCDLKREIENTFPDKIFQNIHMPLTVATFKIRQVQNIFQDVDLEKHDDDSFVIPDFVYNF